MMNQLNVLMQSSDYYAPFCGVTLQSLFENNTDIEQIKVYLISDKIKENNLQKFDELAQKFQREISIIDGSSINEMLANIGVTKLLGSYATYYKIFAANFICEDIERILYLDSDIVVHGSLRELLTYNMNECILAMSLDIVSEIHKKTLGFPTNDYYNAGVILFDWRKWKEEQCEQKIIKHLLNVRSDYPILDQDILNFLMGDQIARLDLKYNLSTDLLGFTKLDLMKKAFGIKNYYCEEEFERARCSPVIYHCLFSAISSKPWYLGSKNPITEEWDKYLLDSPWKDFQKLREKGSMLHKIQRILYRMLPENIFATLNIFCTSIIIRIRCLKGSIFS